MSSMPARVSANSDNRVILLRLVAGVGERDKLVVTALAITYGVSQLTTTVWWILLLCRGDHHPTEPQAAPEPGPPRHHPGG